MSFANLETKEINCKVLYLGPYGSGKRENLRSILKQTHDHIKTGRISLEEGQRSVFQFLPLKVTSIKGYDIKLHLYATEFIDWTDHYLDVLFKGLDGVVFVLDSRIESMFNNWCFLQDFNNFILQRGLDKSNICQVFQYNKRDLDSTITLDKLNRCFNPTLAPAVEAEALHSKGTVESLNLLTRELIKNMSI